MSDSKEDENVSLREETELISEEMFSEEERNKDANKRKTIILAIFTGAVGGHKFYLGEWKHGLNYLIFCWTTIPLFAGLRDAYLYHKIDDWEEYLNSKTRFETVKGEERDKIKRKKEKIERWRNDNKYTIVDKYKSETGLLKIEEWTDGNSKLDGSISMEGSSKGKSRGLIIGPFTGSKTKSSMSAKGDIDASISNNKFTAEIQTLMIRNDNLKLDSDVIEFDMAISEIDRAYETNAGFIVESNGTTFRLGDLPEGSRISPVVRYIENNRSDQPSDSESKSESSENSDKELTNKLEELQGLHEKGVLSDDEFESKKEELLEDF